MMFPLSSQFTNNTLITRFKELKNFTSVIFRGGRGFTYCSNLEQLDTSNVVRIGSNGDTLVHFAFAYCPKLDRLVFKSLTHAIRGGQMFRNSGTRYVIFDVDLVAIYDTGNFSGTSKNLPIYVRDELVDSYKAIDSSHKFLPLSQFPTDFPGETY